MTRRSFAFAAVLLGLACGALRTAGAEPLPDSTDVDGWRLANGLEVRVRHVPGMQGVVITTGYRSGLLSDPEGREGLSEVLAHLQFHAPAGDVPDRTTEELESLRPLGWKVSTTPRLTLLTEVASLPQFPGVLRQVATRMRGVTVTPAALSAAADSVRRGLGARTFGIVDQALYWRGWALARGVSDEALLRSVGGRGLAGLKPKDVEPLLRERFVPANACLALAGDFSNLNVRTLLEQEFAGIPAGAPQPELPGVVLRGGQRVAVWPGLERTVGAIGVVAPALDDSLHPAFLLAGLLTGLQLRTLEGNPAPPLSSRFLFSAYEQPELLRLYPDLDAAESDPAALGRQLEYLSERIGRQVVTRTLLDRVKLGWDWLLGGPLPQGLRKQAEEAPAHLVPLTAGMATRALWRGDAFWERYRRNFENSVANPTVFFPWMNDPANQVRLLLVPRR